MPFWKKWRTIFALLSLGASLNPLSASTKNESGLENRNPNVGKVNVQNHAVVDKSPFFLLKPFRVMVLSGKRPIAIFRADVLLETQNDDTKGILEGYLPRIYDALIQDFYGLAHILWGSAYHPDLMAIKLRSERIIKKIDGEDVIRDVLVQKVFIKPMPKVRDDIDF